MIGLLLRLALDVRLASWAGAWLAGQPQCADELVVVARRESGLSLVSIHEGDKWMERRLGAGQSTRGVHGMVAAFSLPQAPWLLDVPLVSAFVAARRASSWRCRQVAACVRWMECER